jgi:hypothetical protein
MQSIDSVGTIIDSLNHRQKEIEKLMRHKKSQIRQLHSSILSYSFEVQKLIIQNCQLSQNGICARETYNLSNKQIQDVHKTKLTLERKFLKAEKSDGVINTDILTVLSELDDALNMNRSFIILFQERRLGGVQFKLNKSKYETNQIISSSHKNILKLNSDIFKLKKEIRKMKSLKSQS